VTEYAKKETSLVHVFDFYDFSRDKVNILIKGFKGPWIPGFKFLKRASFACPPASWPPILT